MTWTSFCKNSLVTIVLIGALAVVVSMTPDPLPYDLPKEISRAEYGDFLLRHSCIPEMVLEVRAEQGEIVYLSAVSGKVKRQSFAKAQKETVRVAKRHLGNKEFDEALREFSNLREDLSATKPSLVSWWVKEPDIDAGSAR